MNAPAALCRLLVLLSTVLGLTLGTLSPVSAATPAAAPGGGVAALETAPATATISGLVTDPAGRPIDDIRVEALDAANPTADPVASDITYQYGDAEHGAFVLHVPAGDYTVRFSSFEWASASYETLYYGGGAGTTVTVSDGEALTLDPVQLTRDAGVPVTGLVLDENGDPLVGVDVALLRRDSTDGYLFDIDWTRTNSHGRYTFDRVNRNRVHTVQARGDWTHDGAELGYTSLYLGDQLLPSKAQTFTLPPDSTGSTLDSITLSPAATATGTVTDTAGQPVGQVDISLLAFDDTTGAFEQVYGWGWTDQNGDYRLRGLVPGQEYTVLAHGDWLGYQDVYYGGALEEAAATRFTVPTGSTSRTLDTIVLTRPPVRATGTVTDLADGPLEGVSVELLVRYDDDGWVYWDPVQWAETDANGSYRFDRLEPGSVYTVLADGWSAGFGTRYYGDVETEGEARTFSLPADGSPVALDAIALDQVASTLTGRVLLEDGTAVDGYVDVELRRWNDTSASFEFVDSTSSETGRYRFRDVTPGVYTLRAYYWPADRPSSMYAEGWLGNAGEPTEPAGDGVLTVTEDLQSTTATDISLARAATVLTGQVTAADGGKLYGNTDVDLYRWDEVSGSFDWWSSTYTWDSGEYWFTDLPAGTYAVSANYYPYEGPRYVTTWHGTTGERPEGPDAPGAVTVTGSDDTTGADIALRRGQRVTGTVRDDSGNPLSDAWVWAYEWVDHGDGSWTLEYAGGGSSDHRGRYSLAVRPNSNLWIEAEREGFLTYGLGGVGWPDAPTADNTLAVGASDVTHDIAMTADWGDVGSGAVERRSECLQRSIWRSDWIPFGPGLYVTGTGVISEQRLRGYRPEQLAATGRAAVLAPFMARRGNYDIGATTWGISADGTQLCVLWNGVRTTAGTGTNTYQAIVEESPTGGYDVRFNYDQVTWTRDAVVGWTEGTGAPGTHHVLPGSDAGGYLDSAPTGLVHNGTGTTPGRYEFHVADLNGPNHAPENWARPQVEGTPSVGQTLTATPGSWAVDGERRTDLEFVYTWKSNASGVARNVGTGDTYTVTEADRNGRLWVSVQASEGAPQAGFAISGKLTVGPPAATNTSLPQVSPSTPRVGDTLTADAGTWDVADGGTMDDLVASYQWLRDGTVILGETEPTYVVRDTDELASLRVRVTMRRDGYATVRATSDPVVVAASPQLVATTAPSLSGDAAVGGTLTVDPGVWDTDGTGAPEFTYEWMVGYRAVEPDDLSGTSYTLTTEDIGEYVTVYVRAYKPGFRSGTAHAVSPRVSGEGVDFGTLTGTVTRSADGTPVSGAWWQACESQSWNCVWGQTTGSGSFGSSSVLGSATGVDYSITVFAPDGSDLMDGSATTTVVTGQTATVSVELDAVTPPPPNVSVPTSTGTYQGLPTVYWGEEQTIVVEGCDVADPAYTVTFTDGTPSRSGPMTKGADLGGGRFSYSATIPAFYPSHGQTTISTNIPAECGDPEPTSFTIYIDPSGVVTDQYGRPIAGATVTLLRADTPAGPFTVVPDGSDIMSPDNRTNPDTTDGTGFFRWDVAQGFYKVRVDAAGCDQLETSTMPVPPPAIDLLLKLDCDVTAPPMGTPTLSGAGAVGGTLTASLGAVQAPLVGSVQWLRDGAPIAGATDESYTLTAADAGKRISVRHSAQRPTYLQEEGRGAPVSFTAVERTSSAVTVAKGSAPVATAAPSVAGTPAVGQVLTAAPGTWSSPDVTFGYQWLRDGVAIPGAAGATYTPVAADAGRALAVRVTARRAGYQDGSATSGTVGIAKLRSRTVTALPRKVVAFGRVAKVVVRVTAPGLTPTGKVTVFRGRKAVKTVTLLPKHRGRVAVAVGKLPRGRHAMSALYRGNAQVLKSRSGRVTLTIR